MNRTLTLATETHTAGTSLGPRPAQGRGPGTGHRTPQRQASEHHQGSPPGRAPSTRHDAVVAEGDRHDQGVEYLCVGEAR